MNIYFSGSIRGGRDDAHIYKEIILYLRKFGRVLTEHVGDESLKSTGEISKNNQAIHDRDLELLLDPGDCLGAVPLAWSSTGILGYVLAFLGYELVWSPDGNSIAYENAESIIVIDSINGTEEDIFITGVQGFQPNWSPN